METFYMVVTSTLIIFVYTADWSWIASKAFDLIGGCEDD